MLETTSKSGTEEETLSPSTPRQRTSTHNLTPEAPARSTGANSDRSTSASARNALNSAPWQTPGTEPKHGPVFQGPAGVSTSREGWGTPPAPGRGCAPPADWYRTRTGDPTQPSSRRGRNPLQTVHPPVPGTERSKERSFTREFHSLGRLDIPPLPGHIDKHAHHPIMQRKAIMRRGRGRGKSEARGQ